MTPQQTAALIERLRIAAQAEHDRIFRDASVVGYEPNFERAELLKQAADALAALQAPASARSGEDWQLATFDFVGQRWQVELPPGITISGRNVTLTPIASPASPEAPTSPQELGEPGAL